MKQQHIDQATLWEAPAIFMIACFSLVSSFLMPAIIGIPIMLLAFIPVFYGSHEALHNSLIIGKDTKPETAVIANDILCAIGFVLQGMNYRLLRPAHLSHHATGRYDNGYAPDIAGERISTLDYIWYYGTLLGIPALQWQAAGYLSCFMPLKWISFSNKISFDADRGFLPRWIAQVLIIMFWIYVVYNAGVIGALCYLCLMSVLWCLLQNVSHYGLKGIDPTTDRICAQTYILQTPFRQLTFGSLSHLAHHYDMHIPGHLLNTNHVLLHIEQELHITLKPKYGIIAFVIDVLRQLQGPLSPSILSTSWIDSQTHQARRASDPTPGHFLKRKGRSWKKPNDITA